MQKQIIRLGKSLVKELRLEPGVDTMARWMAHYIAEKMVIAKKSKGKDKSQAEQECFDAILRLWQHRSHMPEGHRPLENFELIFQALPRLNPDNSLPYFFSKPDLASDKSKKANKKSKNVQGWLDVALGIDKTARVWLEYVFRQAALNAVDAKTLSWLVDAEGLPESKDISIVVHLLRGKYTDENEDPIEKARQIRKEELEARIKQLDGFNNFNEMVRAALESELKTISDAGTLAQGIRKK